MSGPLGTPLGAPIGPLLHATEPIDPTLWEWLSDKIDHVLGISPGVMILIIGVLIVLFPVVVVVVGVRRRHQMERGGEQPD